MRAEVTVTELGASHTLAMPLAALEEVEPVNPYPVELSQAFEHGVYKTSELRAVLAAALKHGKAKIGAAELIDGVGIKRAAEIARDVMLAAFKDDAPGNVESPAEPENDSGSSSETT